MANDNKFIIENNLKDLTTLMLKLTEAVDRLDAKMDSAEESSDKAGSSLDRLGKRSKKTGAFIEALDGNFFAMFQKLSKGTKIFFLATGAIGSLAYKAKSLIGEAHQLNQQFSGMKDGLTFLASAGNSTNIAFESFGGSKGGFSQVSSALRSLDQAGVSNSKTLVSLSSTFASLEQATGVSADTFGKFGGELTRLFKATDKETIAITSALTAMNFTSGELQETMEGVNQTLEKLGSLTRLSAKDAKLFTQSYAAGVKTLTKFGISAKNANEFLSKIMDPDQFQENVKLFGMLGVSTDKYFEALESGKGAGEFITDALAGAADLGTKLQGMNAQARFQFAKTLGVSPQILSSMAGKSASEVRAIMKEQQDAAAKEKDAKEKEAAAKANAERIEMQFTMMKAKALAPIMKFVNENMGKFMKVMHAFSGVMSRIYSLVLGTLKPAIDQGATLTQKIVDFFNQVASQNSISDMFLFVADKMGNFLITTFKTFYPKVVEFITRFIDNFAKNAKDIIAPIMSAIREGAPIIIAGLLEIFYVLEAEILTALPDLIVGGLAIIGGLLTTGLVTLAEGIVTAFWKLLTRGDLVGVLGALSLAIATIVTITKVWTIITTAYSAIVAIFNGLKAVEVGMYLVLIGAFVAFIAIIVLVVAAVIGLGYIVYKYWDEIVSAVQTAVEWIWNTLVDFFEIVVKIFGWIVAGVVGAIMAIPLALAGIVSYIFGWGDDFMGIFQDIFGELLDLFSFDFSGAKTKETSYDEKLTERKKAKADESYKNFSSDQKNLQGFIKDDKIDETAVKAKAKEFAAMSGLTGTALTAYQSKIENDLKAKLKPLEDQKRKEAEERKRQDVYRKDQMKTNVGTRKANEKALSENAQTNITINQADKIDFGTMVGI